MEFYTLFIGFFIGLILTALAIPRYIASEAKAGNKIGYKHRWYKVVEIDEPTPKKAKK